jgi:3-oxoacyl-[acyl-carrier protein] reductase
VDLRERIALVTGGGGSGLGRTIALQLAHEGAAVVVADIDPAGAEETVRQVVHRGGKAASVEADVTVEPDVQRMISFAERTFGGLDVLVNNAAITTYRDAFVDLETKAWDEIVAANLRSAYLLSVRAARRWQDAGRGGAIVSLSSPGASRAHEDQSAYDVTKAGIEALSRAIAVELGSAGIRANCIAPASVVGEPRPATDLPSGRTTSPDDVADAALFLASPAASQINGHALFVDGGLLARLRADPE